LAVLYWIYGSDLNEAVAHTVQLAPSGQLRPKRPTGLPAFASVNDR